MKIHEKHPNGASIEIETGNNKRSREDAYSYIQNWRKDQPSPEPAEDEAEKGKSGASAYFSAEQDRTYDIDNSPRNYVPVIKAHSISLRVNEGVRA